MLNFLLLSWMYSLFLFHPPIDYLYRFIWTEAGAEMWTLWTVNTLFHILAAGTSQVISK